MKCTYCIWHFSQFVLIRIPKMVDVSERKNLHDIRLSGAALDFGDTLRSRSGQNTRLVCDKMGEVKIRF